MGRTNNSKVTIISLKGLDPYKQWYPCRNAPNGVGKVAFDRLASITLLTGGRVLRTAYGPVLYDDDGFIDT